MSFTVQGGADFHLVECQEEAIAMSPNTTEVDYQPEVKSMEVEPPGIPGGAMEPDTQTPGTKQSDWEMEDLGAPTTEDGCSQVKWVEDSSLAATAQEVVAETPLAEEVLVVEDHTSGCGCPQDLQEDDQVEVHAPNDNPDDW